MLPVHGHLRRFAVQASEHGGYGVVRARLDLNEPPYPPSPRVLAAVVGEAVRLNRYPEPALKRRLEERLAEYSGVRVENVVVACGADLILQALFAAVAGPGDSVVVPFPAFFAYDRMFAVVGVNVRRVRLAERGDEWVLDIGEVVEAVKNGDRVKLMVIDNPNNPTGSLLVRSKGEAVEIVEEAGRRGGVRWSCLMRLTTSFPV